MIKKQLAKLCSGLLAVCVFTGTVFASDINFKNYGISDTNEVNVFTLLNMKSAVLSREAEYSAADFIAVKEQLLNVENVIEPPQVIYPVKVIDEFIPSTTTIDEDFDDYRIVVWIKHQYSEFNKVWSAEYFGVDNIAYVKDGFTFYKNWDIKRKQDYLNQPSIVFRQAVYIYLENPSKENVLKMIQDIENQNLNEIHYASVLYHYDLIDD